MNETIYDFAKSMGMNHRWSCEVRAPMVKILHCFDWPKAAGGWDRIVIFTEFSDKSWSVYLDTPHLGIDETKADLVAMAAASQQEPAAL